MEHVQKIEDFLSEFLQWYASFLPDLQRLKLDNPHSKTATLYAPASEEYTTFFVKSESITFYPEKCFKRGNLPALREKETELEQKVQELSAMHLPAVVFHNFLNRRNISQYNIFVRGICFPHQENVLLQIPDSEHWDQPYYALPRNIEICRRESGVPLLIKPGEKINPGTTRLVQKDSSLTICYGDAQFNRGNDAICKFAANYNGEKDRYFPAERIQFPLVKIGDGTLSAFLSFFE